MNGFRKGSYLANPTGFRASPLSLNSILAGRQNTNINTLALPDYVSYADLQAQKAAAEAAAAAAAAAAAQADNGNDSYSSIGNDYWNDQYQGDGGGWDNEGPGDFDSGGNWGGNDDDGGDYDDSFGWSDGGKIPPMYAVEGSYIDNLLGLADNRTAFDTTTGLMQNMVDPITATVKDAFTTVDDFTGTAYSLAKDKAKGALGIIDPNKQRSYQDLKATSQIKSAIENELKGPNLAVNLAQLANLISTPQAFIAKQLGVPVYNEIVETISQRNDQTEALDPSVEMESLESLPTNIGIGITNPADFNFKDFNYGYTPAKVDTARRTSPATNFMSDLQAALAEELSTTTPATTVSSSAATYNDKDFGSTSDAGHNAPSGGYTGYSGEDVEASYGVSNSAKESANDVSGSPSGGSSSGGGYGGSPGGYGDDGPGGGFGDGDSDSGSGTDGAARGGGGGIGGGNDSFRSAGGRIYASQGDYVNSVGGK